VSGGAHHPPPADDTDARDAGAREAGARSADDGADGAARAAVAAFARAVQLSCLAVRRAAPADLANRAVAAHVAARAWAEEAVRRASDGQR
jgi:hypothetical protein